MAGITSSLESLVSSILHVFRSIVETIFAFFQSIFVMCINFFKGIIDLVGGFLGFVLSNIVILGLLFGGYYVYVNYVVGRPTNGRQGVVKKRA